MVENSAKVAKMARILAIVHIIVGFLLICFGIADRALEYFWTGNVGFGIWIGLWMCAAGGLGILGTRIERSTSSNAFAGWVMGFSITSAVFGGVIIISYSRAIAMYRDEFRYYLYPYYDDGPSSDYNYHFTSRRERYDNFDTEMALSAIILILGIVESGIGIWAAVCLCMMKTCTCCYDNPPQLGQLMYVPNSVYVMTQYPGGVPVAVPMQAGGDLVPVQNVPPGPQGGQPQIVVVPVSGAMTTGYQPQFAQVATSGAMATAYQSQAPPPTYGEGGYTKMEKDEFPVNS